MADTNNEGVGKALDLLKEGLAPFVARARADRSFGRHQSQSATGSDPSRDSTDISSQSATARPRCPLYRCRLH